MYVILICVLWVHLIGWLHHTYCGYSVDHRHYVCSCSSLCTVRGTHSFFMEVFLSISTRANLVAGVWTDPVRLVHPPPHLMDWLNSVEENLPHPVSTTSKETSHRWRFVLNWWKGCYGILKSIFSEDWTLEGLLFLLLYQTKL